MTQMRNHLDSRVVRQEAQRLPSIDSMWATLDPEDRVAFRAEWHDLMDVFRHLVAAHDSGRLDADDTHTVREIAAILTTMTPAMERMRLRQPDPGVLARMKLAAAS
jgi:hypothetical protein